MEIFVPWNRGLELISAPGVFPDRDAAGLADSGKCQTCHRRSSSSSMTSQSHQQAFSHAQPVCQPRQYVRSLLWVTRPWQPSCPCATTDVTDDRAMTVCPVSGRLAAGNIHRSPSPNVSFDVYTTQEPQTVLWCTNAVPWRPISALPARRGHREISSVVPLHDRQGRHGCNPPQ
jgi:hypothetical protein